MSDTTSSPDAPEETLPPLPDYVADMPVEVLVPAERDEVDLWLLLREMIRLPTFFLQAQRFIRVDHFDLITERHYALLWVVLSELHAQGRAIVCESLAHAVDAAITDDHGITPGNRGVILANDLSGLIFSAFKSRPEDYDINYCRQVMRQFLEERDFLRGLRRLTNGVRGAAEVALGVEALQQQRRRFTSANQLPTIVAPDFGAPMPPASVYHPTGIPWIDDQLGGQREGDVNGILGFQGAGKSLLAGQIAVESGRLAARGDAAEWSVLITVEEPATKVLPRLLSCAASVDRRKVARYAWDEFTTTGGPRAEYERHMRTGERERYEQAVGWVNRTVRVLDMSGSADFPTTGTGGVGEIAHLLDQLQQESGRGIRTVAIDWALPLVERSLREGQDDATQRHLAQLGDAVRRQVAERYQCAVWCAHQLRSELATRRTASSEVADHTDAMACKSYAMHMGSCGVLSAPEPSGPTAGIRRAHWKKHRDAADDAIRTALLRPHPVIARFDTVTAFQLDADGELVAT